MADNTSVVLAGCGNMGFAMLQGWLASGALKTRDAFVVEPNDALRDRAAGLGVTAVADAADLAGVSEIVLNISGQSGGFNASLLEGVEEV